MPEVIPDFWPQDIGETTQVTPLSLLKEIASYLGPKTKQLVKAEVNTYPTSGDRFAHSFYLVAPGLDNYKFLLFQVVHPITLYPLTVSWEGTGISISTEKAFVEKLKEIIGSQKTKNAIEVLLSQVSGIESSST